MRLFVAVNLSDDTRSRLTSMLKDLRSYSVSGKYVTPENLHMTLVFLGEHKPRDIAPNSLLCGILDSVSFKPFDMSIDKVGSFRRDGGDIWWAGVYKSKALEDLQRDITEKLTEAGLKTEKRDYIPHITLARKVVADINPWKIQPFTERVSNIVLMKSERVFSKVTYTTVYTAKGGV